MKNQKGITLVALVVTIVVLLILAGISLTLVLGNQGIVKKAQNAKTNYTAASTAENATLKQTATDMETELNK